jgi:hypothetical protein
MTLLCMYTMCFIIFTPHCPLLLPPSPILYLKLCLFYFYVFLFNLYSTYEREHVIFVFLSLAYFT